MQEATRSWKVRTDNCTAWRSITAGESLPSPRAEAATKVEARKVKLTQNVSGGFRCGRVDHIRAGLPSQSRRQRRSPKVSSPWQWLGIAKMKSEKHRAMFPCTPSNWGLVRCCTTTVTPQRTLKTSMSFPKNPQRPCCHRHRPHGYTKQKHVRQEVKQLVARACQTSDVIKSRSTVARSVPFCSPYDKAFCKDNDCQNGAKTSAFDCCGLWPII